MWTYRRDWDAWNVKVMTIGALAGLGAAWVFAAFVSDAAIRLIVGLIGVSFVLNAWFRRPKLVARTVPRGIFWAPWRPHLGCQPGRRPRRSCARLPKMTLVGTMTVLRHHQRHEGRAPALGQFSTATLGTSALLLPLAITTNWHLPVRVTPSRLLSHRPLFVLVIPSP